MQRSGGYNGGLFTESGQEIRDPVAFVAKMQPQEPRGRSFFTVSHLAQAMTSAMAGGPQLYKADGTLVRDPVKYVEAMQKTGGYKGGLMTALGEEVRDPVAYVQKMEGRSVAAFAPPIGAAPARSNAPVTKLAAPARSSALVTKLAQSRALAPPSNVQQSGKQIFKEDGTAVRDPVRYVEAMQRSGGYKGGLMNEKGEEIKDPLAYLGIQSQGGLVALVANDRKALFKADGTKVKNPVAYVQAFEKTGGYKGGLYNHKREEIRDPVAYIAKMGLGN
jgi:hypothetical protein